MRNDGPTAYELLAVAVVPSLPRAASIEWHVIAVVDEPQQRQKWVLMRSLDNCQIKCEAVQSYPTHTTAVAISLTVASASPSTINLDRVLHDMVEICIQAVEEMPGDGDTIPLVFRVFYRTDIVEMAALKAGKFLSTYFRYRGRGDTTVHLDITQTLLCIHCPYANCFNFTAVL